MLLAAAVRLPLAVGATYLSPDAVEYLNIAGHLATGEGYRLSVRAYYVDDGPVVQNGLTVRSPLYPLLITPLAALPGWPRSAGMLNVVLGSLNVGLLYALSRSLAPRAVATAAALVAALSVPMVTLSIRPMSEQLALCLLLLALLAAQRSGLRAPLAAGALLGLGYLARPASAALLPAVALAVLVQSTSGARFQAMLRLVITFGGVVVVAAAMSGLLTGQVSLGSQSFLYAVPRVDLVGRGGFDEGPPPAPLVYVMAHPDEVVQAVRQNLVAYLRALLLDPDWCLPLLLASPAIAFTALRRRLPGASWPLLLGAMLNFAVAVVTWSTFQERYLLPTLVLLIPVALLTWSLLPGAGRLIGGSSLRWVHLPLAVTVFACGAYLARDPFGGASRGPLLSEMWVGSARAWANPALDRLVHWIGRTTGSDEILAHEYPWVITHFTGRPTALLPTKLSAASLERFIRELRIDWVIVDRNDTNRRIYIQRLEGLSKRYDLPTFELGSYRIFATSAVWRSGAGGPDG